MTKSHVIEYAGKEEWRGLSTYVFFFAKTIWRACPYLGNPTPLCLEVNTSTAFLFSQVRLTISTEKIEGLLSTGWKRPCVVWFNLFLFLVVSKQGFFYDSLWSQTFLVFS